jgi:uncharacterized damage-inducible protein DinB
MEARDEIARLIDYSEWATRAVLKPVTELDADELAGPVGEAILDILRHIVSVQNEWHDVLAGVPSSDTQTDLASLEVIAAAFDASHRGLRALLGSRTGLAWEARPVEGLKASVGVVIVQLLVHGVQHRAEIGLMLDTLGRSPGDLDFLAFALSNPE